VTHSEQWNRQIATHPWMWSRERQNRCVGQSCHQGRRKWVELQPIACFERELGITSNRMRRQNSLGEGTGRGLCDLMNRSIIEFIVWESADHIASGAANGISL
jgi:hypothetical protein